MLFFLRGAECLGKPPLCRYCREGWIFCLRLGRRIAEWLDEARPTKDIFRFLAGGVGVVVWRVCDGNTSGGGCGGAGFSLAGAGDAFGRGGLFCCLSCLCGSVFPGQQDCPVRFTALRGYAAWRKKSSRILLVCRCLLPLTPL